MLKKFLTLAIVSSLLVAPASAALPTLAQVKDFFSGLANSATDKKFLAGNATGVAATVLAVVFSSTIQDRLAKTIAYVNKKKSSKVAPATSSSKQE